MAVGGFIGQRHGVVVTDVHRPTFDAAAIDTSGHDGTDSAGETIPHSCNGITQTICIVSAAGSGWKTVDRAIAMEGAEIHGGGGFAMGCAHMAIFQSKK